MKPYTYLIGWTKHNKWYYGSQYSKKSDPKNLWTTYFTSSKFVKEFREKYGEPNIVEVRRVFDSAEKARCWEANVCYRLDVKNDPKWINKHNGDGKFRCTGHTDETKKKIGSSVKGKIVTKETREKMSKAQKGRTFSEETIQKMKIATAIRIEKYGTTKGKKYSPETLEKFCLERHYISPTGEKVTTINLQKFCLENDLSYEGMKRVHRRKYKQHKGWTLDPDIIPIYRA